MTEGRWETSERSCQTGGDDVTLPWIQWYCTKKGHEFYAEVEEAFIADSFNLTGLERAVPYFKEALEVILDLEPEEDEMYSKIPDVSLINPYAITLYGLIHQRYITSHQGLHCMLEKYNQAHFGYCPRVLCNGAHVLPCGQHDDPHQSKVRLYCPNCHDLYLPASSRYHAIDGAHFGTTFPHLFLHTFEGEIISTESLPPYVPRLFGFRIHASSPAGPRMAWLRQWPPTGTITHTLHTPPPSSL